MSEQEKIEKLSEDEIAIFRKFVERKRMADDSLNILLGHLYNKYKMNPTDVFSEDGVIQRKSQEDGEQKA
jgi:hypothetical protein